MFSQNVRAILRFIEGHDVDDSKVGRDLGDRDGRRDLERVRNKVAVVFRHQLAAIAIDGRLRLQPLAGVAQFGDELAVGDAFGIEDEKAHGGHVCILHGTRFQAAARLVCRQPTKSSVGLR